MKKRFNVMAVAVLLASSVMFTSCIGSFSLFNKVLSWNNTVGDKFVNELVFIVMCIVPVYEVAWFIDVVLLNSIEFWTGDNPVAENSTQQIETENGLFNVTTTAAGHTIQRVGTGETVELAFNAEENSWSLVANDEATKLVQFVGDNQAVVYLENGSTMAVSMDQAGLFALKQVASKGYFAAN